MRPKSSRVLRLVAAQLVSDYAGATRVVGEKWQYVFVLLIALGVAWLSLSNVPRWRSLVVNRVIVGGAVWPRVGLLSLPRIFSAGRRQSLRWYLQSSPQKGGRLFYAGTARI